MASVTAAFVSSNKGIVKHEGGPFAKMKKKIEEMKAKKAELASANVPMHGDERHNTEGIPADTQEQELAVEESPAVDPEKSATAFKMKGFSGFGNEK